MNADMMNKHSTIFNSEGDQYSEKQFLALLTLFCGAKFGANWPHAVPDRGLTAAAIGAEAHRLVEHEHFRMNSRAVLMLREFQALLEMRDKLRAPVTRKAVLPALVTDLEARVAKGTKEYGEPLTTHNLRHALQDAYEEAMDQAMYLKQQLMEMGL